LPFCRWSNNACSISFDCKSLTLEECPKKLGCEPVFTVNGPICDNKL
jgi:hypothetical protein